MYENKLGYRANEEAVTRRQFIKMLEKKIGDMKKLLLSLKVSGIILMSLKGSFHRFGRQTKNHKHVRKCWRGICNIFFGIDV